MRIAEEFERCERCNHGWFEEKVFVLIRKDSPRNGEQDFTARDIQYHCVGCGHIQYTKKEL